MQLGTKNKDADIRNNYHFTVFSLAAGLVWGVNSNQFSWPLFINIFWDIMPCSLLKVNRHFGGTCHPHFQGWRLSQARNVFLPASYWFLACLTLQDGGGMFFWNVSWLSSGSKEMSPSWEAASHSATQGFPKIYGTRRFITMFTNALH
jgi:hypothetical protein